MAGPHTSTAVPLNGLVGPILDEWMGRKVHFVVSEREEKVQVHFVGSETLNPNTHELGSRGAGAGANAGESAGAHRRGRGERGVEDGMGNKMVRLMIA